MITNVYIDGFNLYYGALQGSQYRWLNLERLSSVLFPLDQINRIGYFTAPMQVQNGNGGPRQRQSVYWDALGTLPKVEIIQGTFRYRRKRGRLIDPPITPPKIVTISAWEEKKTDVNIATEMIFDAFAKSCEKFVVISNDADLARCIQRLRVDLNVEVFVVNPSGRPNTPKELINSATDVMLLRDFHLTSSQFPATVMTQHGRAIRKPDRW